MNVGLSLRAALRLPSFWIIALGLASLSMLVTGMFFHQVSVFSLQGLDAQTASRAFSISAVVMVLTMPAFGYLLDRLPTRPMFACALLVMSAALVALALVRDIGSMVVFSAVFGLANAGVPGPLQLLMAAIFRTPSPGQHPGCRANRRRGGRLHRGPCPWVSHSTSSEATRGPCTCSRCCPVGCAFMLLFLRPPNLEALNPTEPVAYRFSNRL